MLDQGTCYAALASRDRRFEGRFVAGVTTTGIYCRPGCPARLPRLENVRFFATPGAAEGEGFRACRRCRPDRSLDVAPLGDGERLVRRALQALESEVPAPSLARLAARLGVGERQLRRLFAAHAGAPPRAILASRRLHLARQLLEDTSLPVTRIALQAGFGSLRRFHATFRERFGANPSALRRGPRRAGEGGLVLRLRFRPPLAWDALLAFLAPRAIPGVEEVADGAYRRSFALGRHRGTLAASLAPGGEAIEVLVRAAAGAPLPLLASRCRRLFDLDADPARIEADLARDPALRPLLARHRGFRVPGSWDPFETAVRTVLGQQVSVAAATTLAGRLVSRFGTRIAAPEGGPGWLFPSPATLAAADPDVGLPRARAAALRGLAALVERGALALVPERGLDAFVRELCQVPGIGPWTAHYLAMRGGECDAFPGTDLVLKKRAASAERWRPWRSYAAMLLWIDHAKGPR